jgi:uncharacterized protein YbjT (DUF2867 family)
MTMSRLVTLFGGGGFLGRYVAQELLKAGARVRIAERKPSDAFFVKPQGGLGQTQFVAADVTRADSAARAAIGSDSVINLVGILKGDFDRVHREGAANAAAAARTVGASAFVQLSAIGADPESPSAYGRSKAAGEAAAREAYAGATIIRPSILFGQEDAFVNRFAGLQAAPVVPVLRGSVKFQPLWVADAAKAIAAAALQPEAYAGQTYELAGPEVLTMQELQDWIAKATGRSPNFVPVPDVVGNLLSFGGFLPGAPITRDQWRMLLSDNVASAGASGLEAFGLVPTPIEAVAPSWLVQYRPHGRFAPSIKTPA